ncbi:DUF4136 domain-containing protein [Pseudomonas citronellolis]|uniref:DUF4136 domain-containing protein n=1 Tax=Pseudomonas citronellolis TaxID=53408 RepID=UPI0007789A8D|nr:DUF4136 domain-containing protein [Pseudomonas citronellolis]AMO78915.1 hypothetical protein PcP3B5_55460 [Pseudomonas citronellolis]
MSPRLILLPLLAALAACQSHNPYTSQSLPPPPVPAQASAPGFDPGAYPAAPPDYGRYRSWNWTGAPSGATTYGSSLQDAVSEGLDQVGLRPARPGATPDLRVSARVSSEQRTRQVTDYYGGGYYGGWNDPWYGASIPVTRTYIVQVNVVRIELYDARDNHAVWVASAEYQPSGNQSEQARGLREAVRKALSGYPPH